jgi:hypothetical protein
MVSVLPPATAASRAVQTAWPVTPSTVSPFWFSKVITAALVITFSLPSVHSEVRSGGSVVHLQAKVPGWAVAAPLGGRLPVAVKVSGR